MATESSLSPKAFINTAATPVLVHSQRCPPPDPEEIAAHTKALSRSTIAAANARDFLPTSPGWSHIISDERHRIDGKPANISDSLDQLRRTTEEYPGFHLEILSQDAAVTKSCLAAELLEVFEMSHGNGVITHQAMATHLELRANRWWCIDCSTTRGVVFD